MLHVMGHVSHVTSHMSRFTGHVSHVMCQMSRVMFSSSFSDKVLELIGGGSVINGVYPVLFNWLWGKREAVNAIAKLLQPFPPHPMNQHKSPYCHNILTVSPSYHSKVTPIGKLLAEKIGKAFLLCIFTIEFTTSLFGHGLSCLQDWFYFSKNILEG